VRDHRRTYLALAALIAIYGIFIMPSPSTHPPQGSPARDRQSQVEDRTPEDEVASGETAFLQPLRDFMGSLPKPPRFGDRKPSRADEWTSLIKAVQQHHHFRCLIVSVPDPILSPFGGWFDLTIDSVQRAVETHRNGVLDRMWLPWRVKEKKTTGLIPDKRAFERQPGSMLFRLPARHGSLVNGNRSIESNVELLFVLLVGETPTAGIHKQALTTALDFVNDVPVPKNQTKELKILGPLFSGSEASLRRGLMSWGEPVSKQKKHPPLTIITGSATSILKKDLEEALQEHFESASFHATVIPDSLVLSEVIQHIQRSDPRARIAMLREGNTTYGRKGRPSEIPNVKQEQATNQIDSASLIHDLPFPLYISRLRAAQARATGGKDQTGALGLPANSSITHVPEDQADRTRDWDPVMDPGRSVVEVEQMLSRILQTISREGFRYVGIRATDELDKLFLVQQVRQFCPDVQLFTTISSQILVHPDYAFQTRGMLIGSTYPLWDRSGSPSEEARAGARRVFANQHTQGVFNAALILLDENDPGTPLSEKVLDYSFQDASNTLQGRPPVWISVVGRNGFWPVTVKVPAGDDRAPEVGTYADYVIEVKPTGPPEHPPVPFSWLWLSVIVGMALICGVVCRLGWKDAIHPAASTNPVGVWRELWHKIKALVILPASTDDLDRFRLSFLGIILGVVACFTLALGILSWPTGPADWSYYPFSIVALITAVVLVLLTVNLLRVLPSVVTGGALRRQLWFIPAAVFPVLLLGWFLSLIVDSSEDRSYQFARFVQLGSGLSVLLPLFFLAMAICCCALSVLKGLDLRRRFSISHFLAIDDTSVPPPLIPGTIARLQPIEKACSRINAFLDKPVILWREGRWLRIVILVILGAALWRLSEQSVPSFEPGSYFGLAIRVGFAVAILMFIYTVFRLHILWGLIKDLLEKLAALPIVSAYSRMPPKISSLFGRYMSPQRPHRSHMVLPLHQWGLIVTAFHDLNKGDALKQAINDPDLLEAFNTLAGRYPNQPSLDDVAEEIEYENTEVFRHLQESAGLCFRILQKFWQRLPARDAYAIEFEKKDDKKDKQASGREEYPLCTLRKEDELSPELKQWLQMLEDFVAMQSVPFLCQFFAPLRNLTHCVVLSLLLLLLVVTSYPFQPQRLLLTFLLTLLVVAVGQIVVIYIQMDRDEVLSRISGTTPNKVTFDAHFISSILAYLAPVVAVVLALFGELGGLIAAWLEPLARILK
jgi:hypothetical protein